MLHGKKPKDIRLHNMRSILSFIRKKDSFTYKDVAEGVGISKTTIIKFIDVLKNNGMVVEIGKGESTAEGGRCPDLFTYNESYGYLVSLSVDGDYIGCALMDMKCNILHYTEQLYDEEQPYETIIRKSAETAHGLLDSAQILVSKIMAIVISSSGIIDARNGIISVPYAKKWESKRRIVEDLGSYFPPEIAVYLDNVSRFAGYAELGEDNTLFDKCVATLYMYDELGGAIIQEGHFITGKHGVVGEFSHMSIPELVIRGKKCQWTEVLKTEGLGRIIEDLHDQYSSLSNLYDNDQLDFETLFQAAEKGDSLANLYIDKIGEIIGGLLTNICLVYDPDCYIIQGVYQAWGDRLSKVIYEKFVNQLSRYEFSDVDIQFSKIPFKQSIHLGAGLYAVNNLMQDLE